MQSNFKVDFYIFNLRYFKYIFGKVIIWIDKVWLVESLSWIRKIWVEREEERRWGWLELCIVINFENIFLKVVKFLFEK